MSHQTGIRANDALKKFFASCRNEQIRLMKVSIENEQLVLSLSRDAESTWENDYDKLIKPIIEEHQPCYILYRFDAKNSSGYEWLLISWTPDTAPVRQKMLYASTKATLKLEFGSGEIKEELHGTILSDVTLDGYKKHKMNIAAPAPLSMREEELQEIKRTEVNTEYGVDSKQHTLGGVNFTVTEPAKQAISDMARGSYDYLQFRIDLDKEDFHLVTAENLPLDKLPSKIPKDSARYHLFKFKHTHEGDYTESIVFIYSIPGYSCSVKERMLYSSMKLCFVNYIISLGVEIAKKIEIDDVEELTEKFLYEELHPTRSLHRPKFEKPKGPANRGPKRITRTQAQ